MILISWTLFNLINFNFLRNKALQSATNPPTMKDIINKVRNLLNMKTGVDPVNSII